ncbi:IS1634 family transposase, partial [Heliobacterium undosum]
MASANIRMIQAGAVPVIAKLCRIAKIREIVNQLVKWDEAISRVSPGILIESLIICILCGRKALWKVEQFWAKQDMTAVFRGHLTLEQVNDDAYGHALDKLAEISQETLVSLVGVTLLHAHAMGIRFVHFDTTSKSVQGAYEEEATGDFDVNRGHSKDLRPDLKQFKIGAAVQENGLPIMGQLLSGNTADVTWNPEAAVEMQKFFTEKGYRDVIFVADCALVSTEGLNKLARQGVQFISRLPETFALAQTLKDEAWVTGQWEDLGTVTDSSEAERARYSVYSTRRELAGREYGFLVVHSSHLESRKEKTLQRQFAKRKATLQKEAAALSDRPFACEDDARIALEEWRADTLKQGFHVEGAVECKTAHRHAH